MRNLLIIIFSFLLISFTYSQKSKSHKFVPYFRSLNIEKLSTRLTSDLISDSQKVYAIHSWITHNIKFDVKKWLSFDYSPTSLKKTLVRRKTLDYAYLFNEICKYSNIQSLIIPGYTKNKYVDVSDKFYLDEETWNAVYINNEWRLIDASMDAGEIVYYKRTFAGYFIFAFTFGTSDRLVYRPHFESKPTTKYLYKNGMNFKTNHFPSDPKWQLISPIKLIEEIENDSSYYYNKFDTTSRFQLIDNLQQERLEILKMNEEERIISNGFNSFNFNPKNNYRIANSYYLMAFNNFPEENNENNNKDQLIQKYDSIKIWLEKSIIHSDTNSYFLLKQKNDLIINNKMKKEIISSQNKLLISSTENTQKNIFSSLKIGISGKLLLKTILQRNRIQIYKIVKNKKFSKTNYGKKITVADSTLEINKINSLTDSIKKVNQNLINRFSYLIKLDSIFMKNMEQHTVNSLKNAETTKELCNLRLHFFDDLDLQIRTKKDSLLSHKFRDDSLLIDFNNGPIINHFYSEFGFLKNDFKNLFNFNQLLVLEYCKFKKTNIPSSNVDEKYKETIELFKNEMKQYSSQLKSFKKKFKEILKVSKSKIEPTISEKNSYVKEQYIELQMHSTRSSFINRHYKVRISENKSLKKNCVKLSKKLEKLRVKIELK